MLASVAPMTLLLCFTVTGCNGNECDVNAYCDETGEVPSCRCNSGFRGNGVSCEGTCVGGGERGRKEVLRFIAKTAACCLCSHTTI